MTKYVKLMDGNKSNAGGFEIKINEIVTAPRWNPSADNPKDMGGFNFSYEDKILRWIHRGDTLYDVEIPSDADMIDCSDGHSKEGVFRTNKIILKNPRVVTEKMVFDLYEKSDLSLKTYYQCIVVLLYRNYLNVAKKLIKDKINQDNVDECIKEFERFITSTRNDNINEFNYDLLWDDAKEIYDILLSIKI